MSHAGQSDTNETLCGGARTRAPREAAAAAAAAAARLDSRKRLPRLQSSTLWS